jgi:hypothetical protein
MASRAESAKPDQCLGFATGAYTEWRVVYQSTIEPVSADSLRNFGIFQIGGGDFSVFLPKPRAKLTLETNLAAEIAGMAAFSQVMHRQR